MPIDETIQDIQSPLTDSQLARLPKNCERIQFKSPLTERDFERLSRFLRNNPRMMLRLYGHDRRIRDLRFLRHFSFLKHLSVEAFSLPDLAGIEHVAGSLETFILGQTVSHSFSLGFLKNFKQLKELYLEKHKRDIEVIGALPQLEDLTLRSITLPDLSLLLPLKKLSSLDLKLGGTRNLKLLPRIGRLRYLELWQILKLSDLSMLADMKSLQYLFLQSLKQVTTLPSFAGLKKLRRVYLDNMQGLADLKAVAAAPSLEELSVYDMKQLQVDHFRPFQDHRRLKAVTVLTGRRKVDDVVTDLLGLPKTGPSSDFQFRK